MNSNASIHSDELDDELVLASELIQAGLDVEEVNLLRSFGGMTVEGIAEVTVQAIQSGDGDDDDEDDNEYEADGEDDADLDDPGNVVFDALGLLTDDHFSRF